jgi:hypothetical protein
VDHGCLYEVTVRQTQERCGDFKVGTGGTSHNYCWHTANTSVTSNCECDEITVLTEQAQDTESKDCSPVHDLHDLHACKVLTVETWLLW